jgi:VanZ family protein
MWERGRSSDSGLPLPPPSRLGPVASWRESVSPYSGGTVPDSHRVPSPCSFYPSRAYHRPVSRPVSEFWRLWVPVVAWAGLIFAFSSVPDLGTGLGGWDLVLRKIAHAAEFAVLGALLARAVGTTWVAFALGALYAVSDEVHQSFVPGRQGSPLDVAIDVVGVGLGVVVWQRVARARSLA